MATAHVTSRLSTAIGHAQAEALTGRDALGTLPVAIRNLTAVVSENYNAFHQDIIKFTKMPITITDDGSTAAYGGKAFYTFPQGNIKIEGATLSLTDIDGTHLGSISATFAGKMAVGTVTAADATSQSTTSANVIASTNNAAAVSTHATNKAISTTTITPFDGTTSTGNPISLFLNANVNYADQSGGGTLYVTGTLALTWCNLGDK